MALAAQRNLKAVVELNPLKADGIEGAEIDPSERSLRPPDVVRESGSLRVVPSGAVLELAESKPAFLAVATDVNLLALSSPGEYSAFTALYRRLYEKIKRTSPGTKVFVTFQWEAMQGQGREKPEAGRRGSLAHGHPRFHLGSPEALTKAKALREFRGLLRTDGEDTGRRVRNSSSR